MVCGGTTDESGSEGMRVLGEGVLPVSGQHGGWTGSKVNAGAGAGGGAGAGVTTGFQTSETWHRNSRITRPRTRGQMAGDVKSYMASRPEEMDGQRARVEFPQLRQHSTLSFRYAQRSSLRPESPFLGSSPRQAFLTEGQSWGLRE